MIINHNIAALNAMRHMSINGLKLQNAIETLSSGRRINKAGDDAAGLSISEKMRAQIRGLNQASRNAQDGISLIQTAEGALCETQSMIQRMKELATQAANGTNSKSDRQAIQEEINQLTSEVNRIANSTQFNKIDLLNSGNSSSKVSQNIITGLKEKGWLELAEKRISEAFGITGKNDAKITLEFKSGIDAAAYVSYNNASTDLTLAIDLSDFDPATGESGDTNAGLYADQIIAHEMTHGIMADALGFDKMSNLPTWFKEGTAELIPGADKRLKSHISTDGSLDTSKRDALIDRAYELMNGAEWNSDSLDYAAGYLATKYLDSKANENSSDFKKIFDSLESSTTTDKSLLEKAIVDNTSFSDMKSFADDFKANASTYIDSLELNYSGKDEDTGSIMGIDHNGKSKSTKLNAEDVFDNSVATDKDGQPLEKFVMDWGEKKSSTITLMVGANTGQSIDIDLEDMRSSALSISGSGDKFASGEKNKLADPSSEGAVEYALDVTDPENAGNAIEAYEEALSKVSSFRSKLGAYQNRLEYRINNLTSSAENLQAAEARIRDTDMAKAMMEYTKNNILLQAAQAMLSQANQQTQGILQLLR